MNIPILSNQMENVSLLSSYISNTFNRQFSTKGGFEIQASLNAMNADELLTDRIIYLDEERHGFIESVRVDRQKDKSGEIVVASGIESKDIMSRRITVPPSGNARHEFVDTSIELIVRELLDRNIINPEDPNRKIDIFALGKINGVGKNINFSTRYKPLDVEVYNLLQQDHLGLVCTADIENKKIYFEVRG